MLPPWWEGDEVPLYIETLDYGPGPDLHCVEASFQPSSGGEFPILWRARDGSRACAIDLPGLISIYLGERYSNPSLPLLATLLPFDYNDLLPFWARAAVLRTIGSLSGPRRRQGKFPPFPQAPLVQILEHLRRWSSATSPASACIPLERPAAVVTHDVDSQWILRNDYWLDRFIAIDKECGYRSCWFVVGQALASNPRPIRKILDAGHELGLHGYTHRGDLGTAARPRLDRELSNIRPLLNDYPIKGFRSPWGARSPLLFDLLGTCFDFDSSVPEVEYQLGRAKGCFSCQPFFINNLLELPVTLPDETFLYYVRNPKEYYRLLVDKSSFLKKVGGLINIVHHPFPHFGANEEMASEYERFLKQLSSDPEIEKSSPSLLAASCRTRR